MKKSVWAQPYSISVSASRTKKKNIKKPFNFNFSFLRNILKEFIVVFSQFLRVKLPVTKHHSRTLPTNLDGLAKHCMRRRSVCARVYTQCVGGDRGSRS